MRVVATKTNFLISPVSFYFQPRMKQLNQDTLIKVVAEYYSTVKVEKAYEELYDNFPEEERSISLRKKSYTGKSISEKQIEDMILLIQEMSATKKFEPPVINTDSCDFP